MSFYDGQHRFYCGVDLHIKRMYLCILDQDGSKRQHWNVQAKPHVFLSAVRDFRDDLVVGVECIVHLVLVGRSLPGRRNRLRAWSRSVYESDSWRQEEGRQA